MQCRVGVVAAVGVVLLVAGTAGAAPTAGAGNQTADSDVSIRTYIAPAAAADELAAADTPAEANVSLTSANATADWHTLVVELRGPDLAGAVADQPGGTRTERALALLDSEQASLSSTQVAGATDDRTKRLALTDADAVTAVRVDADTYHLVYDVSSLDARTDDGERVDLDGGSDITGYGDVFRITFTYGGESARTGLAVVPAAARVGFPDGRPVLYPTADQRVRFRTTVAPGETITVELVGTGDRPFGRVHERVAAAPTNRWRSVAFDLRDAPAGSPVTVVVRRDGVPAGSATGRIAALSATLSAPDRTAPDRPLTLTDVSLSQDGFLVVRAGGTDGPVVGTRYLGAEDADGTDVAIDADVTPDHERVVVTGYADVDGDRELDAAGPDLPLNASDPVLATVAVVPATDLTPAETGTPAPAAETSPTTPADDGTFTPHAVTSFPRPGPAVGFVLATMTLLVALLARRAG